MELLSMPKNVGRNNILRHKKLRYTIFQSDIDILRSNEVFRTRRGCLKSIFFNEVAYKTRESEVLDDFIAIIYLVPKK